MKITQVARLLETTPRTIRYYEEKGLIFPKKRDNDYRYYEEDVIKKLQTILALREVGMTTAEIKENLEGNGEVFSYLNKQRSVLYDEMIQIKDMIATLDQMITTASGDEEELIKLAKSLKEMKRMRKSWQDDWDFDGQAESYGRNIKTTGFRFNVHQHYDEALRSVRDWIDTQPGEQGLDIGIGTGNLASLFIEKDVEMVGVDQSEEMLKVCVEKHPGMDVRQGHFLALPVNDNTRDFIVSSYALHHLSDDEKEHALAEMDRVLMKGGRIAVADLMFEDASERRRILDTFLEEGNEEAVEAIEAEFYADRSKLLKWWKDHGYEIKTYQFNRILHLIFAQK